jgi:hypothetical protein
MLLQYSKEVWTPENVEKYWKTMRSEATTANKIKKKKYLLFDWKGVDPNEVDLSVFDKFIAQEDTELWVLCDAAFELINNYELAYLIFLHQRPEKRVSEDLYALTCGNMLVRARFAEFLSQKELFAIAYRYYKEHDRKYGEELMDNSDFFTMVQNKI